MESVTYFTICVKIENDQSYDIFIEDTLDEKENDYDQREHRKERKQYNYRILLSVCYLMLIATLVSRGVRVHKESMLSFNFLRPFSSNIFNVSNTHLLTQVAEMNVSNKS